MNSSSKLIASDFGDNGSAIFQTQLHNFTVQSSMEANQSFQSDTNVVVVDATQRQNQINTLVADNSHIVIPLMSFVFGFPVLVMTILCIIQERNKWIYERKSAMRLQQARMSTTSTFNAALRSTRSMPLMNENAVSMKSTAATRKEFHCPNGICKSHTETTLDTFEPKVDRTIEWRTKLSDETLEEIDELENDESRSIFSAYTTTDKAMLSADV